MVKLSSPAHSTSAEGAQLNIVRSAWARVRAGRVPYHVGDVVIGDDEFLGRKEGQVMIKTGPLVGVKTPDGTFFYDYRQLRQPD